MASRGQWQHWPTQSSWKWQLAWPLSKPIEKCKSTWRWCLAQWTLFLQLGIQRISVPLVNAIKGEGTTGMHVKYTLKSSNNVRKGHFIKKFELTKLNLQWPGTEGIAWALWFKNCLSVVCVSQKTGFGMEICKNGINWGLTSLKEQRRSWAAILWQQPQTIPQGARKLERPIIGVPNWDKGSRIFLPMLWSVAECRTHPERGCELGWGSIIQLRAFPPKRLSYQQSAVITCGALAPKAGPGCTTDPLDSTPAIQTTCFRIVSPFHLETTFMTLFLDYIFP